MPATPRDLISAVAAATSLPSSTVRNYDRKLMEAGLRSKNGHGPASAIMTAVDGSLLLTAVASTDEMTRAPECTLSARSLPLVDGADALCGVIGGSSSEFATFGAALDGIMQYLVETKRFDYFSFSIVEFGRELVSAEIVIEADQLIPISFYQRGKTKLIANAGRKVIRAISSIAVDDVARCVAGREPALPPDEELEVD